MSNIKHKKFSLFKNLNINSKMISFTFIIIIFAGLIATYGLFQINDLNTRLHTIRDKDWIVANGYTQINTGINAQLSDLYAYTQGVTDRHIDFVEQKNSIENYIHNINNLMQVVILIQSNLIIPFFRTLVLMKTRDFSLYLIRMPPPCNKVLSTNKS